MGATADINVTKEVIVISALLSLCKHQPMDINMPPAQRPRPGLRANVALYSVLSVQSFIPIDKTQVRRIVSTHQNVLSIY